MTTNLKALLFDMDGVLVDSRDAISRSINRALVAHGIDAYPEEDFHALVGAPLPEVFIDILRAHGKDETLVASCLESYRERYVRRSAVETHVYDGIADTLAVLGARYPLAIASTRPAKYSRPILEALGIATYFTAVQGSPPLDMKAEPKAATVGRALRDLGLTPTPDGETPVAAMIGDRLYDVHGGRANGLWTVGVTWGAGSEEELVEAGVETLVRQPPDLVALFG